MPEGLRLLRSLAAHCVRAAGDSLHIRQNSEARLRIEAGLCAEMSLLTSFVGAEHPTFYQGNYGSWSNAFPGHPKRTRRTSLDPFSRQTYMHCQPTS